MAPDDLPGDDLAPAAGVVAPDSHPSPFLPTTPAAGERAPLLPSQRPVLLDEREQHLTAIEWEAARSKGFQLRRPFSDVLLRWLVVLVPAALAALAGLLGVEFQKRADSVVGGLVTGGRSYVGRIRELTASMGAICVVGLVALSLWSWLMVTNTNRVAHSLRTPWFAAVGWVLAPGLGLAAHLTLDNRLDSGSLVGFTVFLAVLYLPFGTLGGAAGDLGGSPHLARTWFLASVIGAFLLIAGVSGATSVLPVDDPQNVFRVRAFTCYLSALMMLASSALAFATARDLNALVNHRWAKEEDPHGVFSDPRRHKVHRTGRKINRRLTPTLFLRVIVALGLLATGIASVGVTFVFRGRYVRAVPGSAERDLIVDDLRNALLAVAVVGVAVRVVYVVWAVVAARNANRRSIIAPSPWAVFIAFTGGPLVMLGGSQLTGPFGAAVLTLGVILAAAGYVIGQLVLGRTVTTFGGSGRIFATWMVADIAMTVFAAFVSANSTNRVQLVAFGVAQTGMAMLSAALAWTAMSRLDRTCRSYRHIPTANPDGVVVAAQPTGASELPVPGTAAPSLALTSSQS